MDHPYDALSDDDKYHLSVGQMMAAWSMAETQVTLISVMVHRYGRGKEFEKHLPRAFGRKIAMIRDSVPIDPKVSDYGEIVSIFCDSAELGASERNLIVHGSTFRPFGGLPLISFRLDHFDWKEPPEEMRLVSHAQVLEVLDLSCRLALVAGDIADAFARAFGVQQRNETAGEG